MKKQINILLVGLASVFMSCSDVEGGIGCFIRNMKK